MLIHLSTLAMLNFLFSFAQIEARDIPDGVMPKQNYKLRRAVGTGGGGGSSTSSSDNPSTNKNDQSSTQDSSSAQTTDDSSSNDNGGGATTSSSTVPTTVAVTTTNDDGSTVTSHVSTKTAVAASTQKTSLVKVGSKTINAATLTKETVVSSALVTRHTEKSTFTSYWTTNGEVHSSVVTTQAVVASTTGYAKTTVAPALAGGGGNGQNLTTHTKAIVGGVVGGIGGAILIGGLAFVAWRLWGKKKAADDDDDAAGFGKAYNSASYQGSAMSMNPAGHEAYSNPGGQVNTASNF